jgi:arylformamidase
VGGVRLLDVTVPVRPGMPVYEGNPEVFLERVLEIAAGHDANVTRLDLGAHTGTHVDAPVHFIDDAPGAEVLPLEVLVGPAHVVDATAATADIDLAALEAAGLPPDAVRLLVRTRNSALWADDRFHPDSLRLTPDAARALVDRGVRLVGWDYLSVGGAETHHALLGAGVVVVEGLDLREAPAGPCRLLCLPLRLPGSDGAPARAVLELP